MAPAPRAISLTTPLGDDAVLLTGFSGREELSRLFSFQLDLTIPKATSAQAEAAFRRLLGAPVTIAIPDSAEDGPGRRFSGFVSRFSQGGPFLFRAEVVPWLWFRTRSRNSRTFQDVHVPDMLRSAFGDGSVRLELSARYVPREYCVQYRESDFDFASRLMEEEGIYYYFEHSADGSQLVVADSSTGHPHLQPGLVVDLTGRKSPAVVEWEKTQEVTSGRVTLWDHAFELPHNHLEATAAILPAVQAGSATHDLATVSSGYELFDYPGGYAKRFDGDFSDLEPDSRRTAAIRMEEEAVRALTIEGGSTCRNLAPGYQFTLLSPSDAAGDYVVTSVQHDVRVLGDVTKPKDLDYANRFTCIPAGLPFRPARTTPRPVIAGPQTAYVVGPPGQQIYTDRYGRVKVQFHWDREGRNDDKSSAWIRVGALHAGDEGGSAIVPRVGWEVVVDFLEGDPDQPIIVGSVYNPEHLPPFPGGDR